MKTIAKPVSAILKVQASRRPVFGGRCAYIGENIHQVSSRINVIATGYTFVGAKPLTIEDARNKGVEFISEFMILITGGVIVILEV